MAGTGMTGNTIDLGVGTDTLKFTAATNSDTVTVTSTTITGAKSSDLTKKQLRGVAITTGAGADVVVFEDAVTGTELSPPILVTIRSSSSRTQGHESADLVLVLTLFMVPNHQQQHHQWWCR